MLLLRRDSCVRRSTELVGSILSRAPDAADHNAGAGDDESGLCESSLLAPAMNALRTWVSTRGGFKKKNQHTETDIVCSHSRRQQAARSLSDVQETGRAGSHLADRQGARHTSPQVGSEPHRRRGVIVFGGNTLEPSPAWLLRGAGESTAWRAAAGLSAKPKTVHGLASSLRPVG